MFLEKKMLDQFPLTYNYVSGYVLASTKIFIFILVEFLSDFLIGTLTRCENVIMIKN